MKRFDSFSKKLFFEKTLNGLFIFKTITNPHPRNSISVIINIFETSVLAPRPSPPKRSGSPFNTYAQKLTRGGSGNFHNHVPKASLYDRNNHTRSSGGLTQTPNTLKSIKQAIVDYFDKCSLLISKFGFEDSLVDIIKRYKSMQEPKKPKPVVTLKKPVFENKENYNYVSNWNEEVRTEAFNTFSRLKNETNQPIFLSKPEPQPMADNLDDSLYSVEKKVREELESCNSTFYEFDFDSPSKH